MGIEIPGVTPASPLPQRQMPKTLKKSRYGSWKERVFETSQHQFRTISIANQPTQKLADNCPSYLHQYTCDMARHFCACQHYKLRMWSWLSSPSTEKLLLCLAPPLSSLHKTSMLPQHQSGIIYCGWSSDRNRRPPLLSPKRDALTARSPQEQRLPKREGFTQVL